jgi:CDP-diacylglycerol--serine O-phosphatidyltransferase
VPFAAIVLIALAIAADQRRPGFGRHARLCLWPTAFSGYVVYIWRKAKGMQTSVISTSTDEPDERGLHK